MKKYLVALFVTILALASCAKDLDEGRINGDNPIEEATTILTFASERPQLDPTTKTAWGPDLDGKGGIVWSTGDKIKIGFTFNGDWWGQTAPYASGNPSPNNNIKFYQSNEVVIDPEHRNIGTFTVPTTFGAPTTSGDFVFYAVYPGTLVDNNQKGAPAVDINLHTTQTPATNSFDPNTDILVGKSRTISPEEPGFPSETIDLFWTRVVAHGDFTLKNFQNVQGNEIITKVIFTAQEDANLTGEQIVTVADGAVTGKNTSNAVTLKGTNLSFVTESGSKNLHVWLSVIPVTLTSLDVVVETNKATYHKSFTGFTRNLLGNRHNTMGINMADATRVPKQQQYHWVRRNLAAITEDDVFVIVGHPGLTPYAMTNNNGASSNPSIQQVTIDGNKVVSDVDTDIQWKLSRSSNGYTFHPNGANTSLYCGRNNTNLRIGNESRNVFTLSSDGYLVNTSTNRYIVVYYNRDWRCYDQYAYSYLGTQFFTFYVRVDAASYNEYSTTFESGTTFTQQNTDYTNGGSFINTCDGMALTLTNVNNSNSTVMSTGSSSRASVATITTVEAIPEAIKSVTMTFTEFELDYCKNITLLVSPTSDFSSSTEYEFDGWVPSDGSPSDLWVTISAPAENMYYKIVIDFEQGDQDGLFEFNKILYAE